MYEKAVTVVAESCESLFSLGLQYSLSPKE